LTQTHCTFVCRGTILLEITVVTSISWYSMYTIKAIFYVHFYFSSAFTGLTNYWYRNTLCRYLSAMHYKHFFYIAALKHPKTWRHMEFSERVIEMVNFRIGSSKGFISTIAHSQNCGLKGPNYVPIPCYK